MARFADRGLKTFTADRPQREETYIAAHGEPPSSRNLATAVALGALAAGSEQPPSQYGRHNDYCP